MWMYQRTPLHLAVSVGDIAMVNYLVITGEAKLDVQDLQMVRLGILVVVWW